VIRYHKQGNGGCFLILQAETVRRQKALKYMKTDRNTVMRAAELSKLILTEDETEKMVTELGKLAEIIGNLDIGDIPETGPNEALPLSAAREDEVKPSAERDKILQNAPEHTEEYFGAPDTFDKGGDE